MTLTEDELARLADDVRSLPMFRSSTTVGYLEWDWVHRPTVLSLIAALRDTPVADTAGIDPRRLRHGTITYDDQDEWLVEDGVEGTARVVARDVPRWFGRLVVAALSDGAMEPHR